MFKRVIVATTSWLVVVVLVQAFMTALAWTEAFSAAYQAVLWHFHSLYGTSHPTEAATAVVWFFFCVSFCCQEQGAHTLLASCVSHTATHTLGHYLVLENHSSWIQRHCLADLDEALPWTGPWGVRMWG